MQTTTTTTAALLSTSLLAALASAQSTVVYTGEPGQIAPGYSLNPTQSAIVQKYTSDIGSALDALATGTLASNIEAYLQTATVLPSAIPSAALAALEGQPVPTDASNPFTVLPSSLVGPVVSAYDDIASIASGDLSADPALTTEAPYFVEPAEATSREKITEVRSGTKKPHHTGTGGYAKPTGTVGFATRASGSGVAVAYGTGVGVASGYGSSSGLPSLSPLPTTSTATGAPSPITSAKPTGGASSSLLESRASLSVAALVVVGCVFVGLL